MLERTTPLNDTASRDAYVADLLTRQQWKAAHREQFERCRADKRYRWPPVTSTRWAWDFELAVAQRGEQAKEAAFKRGELRHARHAD